MLIKEYRIPLPMSVEAYRIAQLYMIQRKSREESSGEGSGVEIIENKPYTRHDADSSASAPSGQYTKKIYHIGSHLPGWFRAILPKSALIVEEEAWNAYPYTKTIYKCPFIQKFVLEIETKYIDNTGETENIFNLSEQELRERKTDLIDIVNDYIPPSDYCAAEDPKLFRSKLRDVGPLESDWLTTCREKGSVMCAYKLCKVEFKYWGMQKKIEDFIHEVGLRKTMLRAHRQAWSWQDEYDGLTIDDIRRLERETELALKKKMHATNSADEATPPEVGATIAAASESSELEPPRTDALSNSIASIPSKCSDFERLQASDDEQDEFFDAHEEFEEERSSVSAGSASLIRSSSIEMLDDAFEEPELLSSSLSRRVEHIQHLQNISAANSLDLSLSSSTPPPPSSPCQTTILFLVIHGGSVNDSGQEKYNSSRADANTLWKTMHDVLTAHYSTMCNRITLRLVTYPSLCADTLETLASLNPYNFTSSPTGESSSNLPLQAVPLFVTHRRGYADDVSGVIARTNDVYRRFLKSDEGKGFSGQVCLIGDCVGSILAWDALCKDNPFLAPRDGRDAVDDHHVSRPTDLETIKQVCLSNPDIGDTLLSAEPRQRHLPARHTSCPNSRRTSTETCSHIGRFDFEVSDFFMLGSPISVLLAYRKACCLQNDSVALPKPSCAQLFNLFYPMDPLASRLEPLLYPAFSKVAPIKISRYQKFPLGDGQSVHVVEALQSHPSLFAGVCDGPTSVLGGDVPAGVIGSVTSRWWGAKRLDYALYCPDALQSFPSMALPYLLHASFWESHDTVSFLLRQVLRQECSAFGDPSPGALQSPFHPEQPREKWLKRRTAFKLHKLTPNHRGNDVIVQEGQPQTLHSRFAYGPLDLFCLSGEKVDVHVMNKPSSGEWIFLGTDVTDSRGRLTFTIPEGSRLDLGIYPVKMVVRGDHTTVDFWLAVLPPKTECVVFSIDGSFAASVSVTGHDPKVRPGAVDVVRHWQDHGYLIVYITARPDMQQKQVLAWLAQHNFPHGMVMFSEGVSVGPARHKTGCLLGLEQSASVLLHAAYGSTKDIGVYKALGLQPDQVFTVGKKHHKDATVLSKGYATHLSSLQTHRRSRAAVGNARMLVRRGCFSLPGQNKNTTNRKAAQRTISLPHPTPKQPSIVVGDAGNTVVESASSFKDNRARVTTPRIEILPYRHESMS